ncbi:MAG: hypothetical protein JWP57_1190, partial [Spirosoma sp.]|nr:hypothetical protein [Spirosoma sp.]
HHLWSVTSETRTNPAGKVTGLRVLAVAAPTFKQASISISALVTVKLRPVGHTIVRDDELANWTACSLADAGELETRYIEPNNPVPAGWIRVHAFPYEAEPDSYLIAHYQILPVGSMVITLKSESIPAGWLEVGDQTLTQSTRTLWRKF